MLCRARFVDHVNRLVGQFAVVDVTRGQFDGGFDRIIGVADVVVVLEIGFEAHKDFHGVIHGGLVDVDFLEPARQSAVFFEMLTEFFVGGRAHAAQLAALKCGFEQVGGIHRAARGGPCADDGVDLVDKQDRIGVILKLFHHRFEAFLEIPAIARSGQKRAHVERVDRGLGEDIGGFAIVHLFGEPFGDGGFTHAGIAHQKRVVFTAAA